MKNPPCFVSVVLNKIASSWDRVAPKSRSGKRRQLIGSVPKIAKFIFAFAAVIGIPTACSAVLVFEEGSSEPIKGYLRDIDETRLYVDELLPDGSTRPHIFLKTRVRFELTVDNDRLAALRPEQPRAYRMYAEELSEKRTDPDAEKTAIRLYLIAAYLDPENLGRGCLLAMADLARTPAQQRIYRAMAYLLDADHDRRLLRAPETRPSGRLATADREELRSGLRALRSGRKNEAARMARRDSFQKALAGFASIMSLEEFEAAARDREEWLPPPLLQKVIRLELAISPVRTSLPEPVGPNREARSWASVDWRHKDNSVTMLSLQTITEFDPRNCLFRDGRWVPPPGD